MDARHALKGERPALMAEFEKQLRRTINDRITGKIADKPDFSKADTANLTLVETSSMDESVLTGNITRIVENLSHDELLTLNRGLGFLLGRPDWHRRQSAFPVGDRRGLRRGAEDRQDRPAHQVPDPEGAEPGADGRHRRHLRGTESAPRQAQGHSRRRAAVDHQSWRRSRPRRTRAAKRRGRRSTLPRMRCHRSRRHGHVQAHVRQRDADLDAALPACVAAWHGRGVRFGDGCGHGRRMGAPMPAGRERLPADPGARTGQLSGQLFVPADGAHAVGLCAGRADHHHAGPA